MFYIISGCGIIITEEGEQKKFRRKCDVCPPTQQGVHKIANTSADETLVYIEFDSAEYPEIVHYPHTNTFGIGHRNADNEFFRSEAKIDYARDVETSSKDG